MVFLWWHWIVIGFVLVGFEMLVPAFYLIWFGLGALLVGLVLLAVPLEMSSQILLWTITSTACVLLWFRYLKPRTLTLSESAAQIVGEVGLLTRDIVPFQRGEARFQKPLAGSDVWVCIAEEAINAGVRVRVVAVEGNTLKITKA